MKRILDSEATAQSAPPFFAKCKMQNAKCKMQCTDI